MCGESCMHGVERGKRRRIFQSHTYRYSVIHGVYFYGFDSTVDLLKRNGVEITDPHMIRAKESIINRQDYEKDSFYKYGKKNIQTLQRNYEGLQ